MEFSGRGVAGEDSGLGGHGGKLYVKLAGIAPSGRRECDVETMNAGEAEGNPSGPSAPARSYRHDGTYALLLLQFSDRFDGVLEEGLVVFAPDSASAGVNLAHHFARFVELVGFHAPVGPEAEAGNESRRECAGGEHAAVADVGTGHEAGADGGFAVVANHGA